MNEWSIKKIKWSDEVKTGMFFDFFPFTDIDHTTRTASRTYSKFKFFETI